MRQCEKEIMGKFEALFEKAEEKESAFGFFDERLGRYDLTWSGIISILIKEAGKKCERFASDLFIDCSSVQEALEKNEIKDSLRLFGFRDSGVDGTSEILAKLSEPSMYGTNVYKTVWGLGFKTSAEDKSLTMSLRKLYDADGRVTKVFADLKYWNDGCPCPITVYGGSSPDCYYADCPESLDSLISLFENAGVDPGAEFAFEYMTDSEFPAEARIMLNAARIRQMRYFPEIGFTPAPPTETSDSDREGFFAEIFSNAEKGVAETFGKILEKAVEVLNG